jgi:hypothetical protein
VLPGRTRLGFSLHCAISPLELTHRSRRGGARLSPLELTRRLADAASLSRLLPLASLSPLASLAGGGRTRPDPANDLNSPGSRLSQLDQLTAATIASSSSQVCPPSRSAVL